MRTAFSNIVGAIIVITMMTCVAACSTTAPKDKITTPESRVTTIRVMLDSSDYMLDSVIAAFQDSHPTVRVTKVLPAATDELRMDALRNKQADIVSISGISKYSQANLLLDLAPYLQKSGLDVKPYGASLDSLRSAGKIYALPAMRFPVVLAYNREMVKAANVTIPTQWTWDEFRDVAAQLAKGEDDARIWGFDPLQPEEAVSIWFKEKTGQAVGATVEDLRQGLVFFQAMQQDRLMPAPTLKSGQAARSLLLEGKAAMGFVNLSVVGSTSQKDRFAIAPIPTIAQERPAGRASGVSLGIASMAESPDVAWEFLSFLCGPEGSVTMAKHGILGSYLTPQVEKSWEDASNQLPGSQTLFQTRWYGPQVATPSRAGRMYEAERTAVTAVLSGQTSLENALSTYSSQLQALPEE